MNGIGLLLLLAMAGQVGPGTERDYGWEYSPDGVLQYIVQISPQKAEMMKQRSVQFPQGQPNISVIPPELVGKIGQIEILIGNEILPRNPSIEELRRFPRVGDTIPSSSTAQLGVPKYVEPELMPINQSDTPPSLPAFPGNNGSGPSASFKDKFSRATEPVAQQAENLVDQAKSIANALEENANDSLASVAPDPSLLAQNGVGSQAGDFLNGLRSGGSATNPPPSKFQSLEKSNNSGAGLNNGSSTIPSMPPLPSSNSQNLNNQNFSNNPNSGSMNPNAGALTSTNQRESASSAWPGANQQQTNNTRLNTQGLNTSNLNNPALQQQTPSPTFGSAPAFGNTPSYSSAPNSNSQMYNPNLNTNMGYDRIASNAGIAGSQPPPSYASINNAAVNNGQTPVNSGFNTSNVPSGQASRSSQLDSYPPANNNTNNNFAPTTTNSENVLRFSFLASLIVNVYLGFLIRKLLTRYRLLLVNTRNQMA